MLPYYLFQFSCILFLFVFSLRGAKGRIHVLINSMKDHYISVQTLMESFQLSCGSNFASIQFWIVYGGYYDLENYNVGIHDNVIKVEAYHNSIDFTALITILELFQHSDFLSKLPQSLEADDMLFYMHDTCKVGPGFCDLLLGEWSQKATEEQETFMTARLSESHSMNIGLYRLSYLFKYLEFLVFATINTNPSYVNYYKTKGMVWEDFLFQLDPDCQVLAPGPWTFSSPYDVYGTGVLRRMEYFEAIDFYKFKSNWDYRPGDDFELRE